MNLDALKKDVLDPDTRQMKSYALLKPDLLRLIAVAEMVKPLAAGSVCTCWPNPILCDLCRLRAALAVLEEP